MKPPVLSADRLSRPRPARGPQRMSAAPARQTLAPTRSRRSGFTPSATQSHPKADKI
jgi:hypothetical protein